MQFREQGRRIQCIRSTYSTETKRCHQRVVASFSRWTDKLPYDELIELTPAERQELEAWFEARQASKNEEESRLRISVAFSALQKLADAIKAVGISADEAAAVWAGLADIAKALRKAGHPKPKRERPARVALPGQADLLADAAEPSAAFASTGV